MSLRDVGRAEGIVNLNQITNVYLVCSNDNFTHTTPLTIQCATTSLRLCLPSYTSPRVLTAVFQYLSRRFECASTDNARSVDNGSDDVANHDAPFHVENDPESAMAERPWIRGGKATILGVQV